MNLLHPAAFHRGLDELRCADKRSLKEKVAAHRAKVAEQIAKAKGERQ